MIAPAPMPKTTGRSNRYPNLLENGAHLSASEFLRRYEANPEVPKAEIGQWDRLYGISCKVSINMANRTA